MTPETFITILSASGLILVTFANIFYNKHYRDLPPEKWTPS